MPGPQPETKMINEWMWGMHGWWLIFWAMLILGAVLLAIKMRIYPPRESFLETPLEILQRRYAEGEITDEEFERQKAHLQGDKAGI